MAEQLRRWTSDLMVALRAGLSSGTGFFFFFMMMMEQRAGMSAVNVGASRLYVHQFRGSELVLGFSSVHTTSAHSAAIP